MQKCHLDLFERVASRARDAQDVKKGDREMAAPVFLPVQGRRLSADVGPATVLRCGLRAARDGTVVASHSASGIDIMVAQASGWGVGPAICLDR